jgi:hypothetical protein
MEMAYRLEGSSQEACTCEWSCPCWAGNEPDEGCDTIISWRIDEGSIEGVDVSGRSVAVVADVPCSAVNQGTSNATFYVDDESTPEQEEALLNTWKGKLGGPVADLAQLFGELASVKRAPITFSVDGGRGKLEIGQEIKVDTATLREAEGRNTTIQESVISTAEWNKTSPSQEYSAVEVSFRFEA